MHPRHCAFRASCPKSTRPRPVFRRLHILVQAAESARSIAPPLRASRPLPPQCNGDPTAARSCAQKQKAKAKSEKREKSNGTPDALLGRAGCASLLGPFTLRRQGTIRPVRVGAGPRRFRWVHGRTFSGTRPLTRTFRAGARKAQCEGVLLFGYFLLHKQEKVTRSPQASGSLGA